MTKNTGYIVELKDGRKGRTIHNKPFVNGKVPVYLCVESKPTSVDGVETCVKYSFDAILCEPRTLTPIGFID